MYTEIAAVGCIIWSVALVTVCSLGTVFHYYTRLPSPPISSHLDDHVIPHVTIIRPCKGLEPYLFECLAATCYQDYPAHKLTVYFCVASKTDPAYEIITSLLEAYTKLDLKVFIEDEDLYLRGTDIGPNPKIRNMSRAYRQAKGDIVWILDCNIWTNRGACGRMVDKLCGFEASGNPPKRPYKLVAHLPVCVSVDDLGPDGRSATETSLSGGLFEQSFLSSSHAKMYVAINTVAIAPCINGKSTAFRRSHLNYLTNRQGIDQFGQNICEDHLIGDLLWKSSIPLDSKIITQDSAEQAELDKTNPLALPYKNHGIVFRDLAIQPVANMALSAYIARRVRWLRVRKFTVPAATLVEPGTESFLASAMLAWSLTSLKSTQRIVGSSLTSMLIIWVTSVTIWCVIDYFIFGVLQGGETVGPLTKAEERWDAKTGRNQPMHSIALPSFAKQLKPASKWSNSAWLPFTTWLTAWLGRESLAFPIWAWAIWGGTTVTWRDRKFWVGLDMKVHQVPSASERSGTVSSVSKTSPRQKIS